jgi:hypothetical protein
MGNMKYQRNKTATLYVNFLTLEGKEPSSVVDPKITIRHIDSGGSLVTDVNEALLTHAIETLYFYKWSIPSDADLGEYTIEYEATVDGEYAEANETAEVIIEAGTATRDYTTVQKVADYLGVDVSNIQEDWIDWASAYIELYTNAIFGEVATVEKKDIEKSGVTQIFLDHFPVISVTELKNDGEVVDTADYLVYEEEGIIKFADDFLGNIYNVGAFVKGRQSVEVTYRYGYSSVPDEISWAATVIASQIAFTSLVNSGAISFGNVIEEEIGEYRYRESARSSVQDQIQDAQRVADRLEEDVLSVKNVLRIYRTRKMRAV